MAQFRTDQHKLDFTNNRTRYEVFMMSDRLSPSGTLTDAFGRLRVSNPVTLFDSSHRFQDNGLWSTSNTAGGTYSFTTNQSLISLNVNTANNAEVVRETTKVFAYQPGKSLLIMNTFAMNTPKENLRQRVGYFGAQNGVYLENDGTTTYFVLRTYTSGQIEETRVAQTNWNIDKFDGNGYSAQGGSGSEHASGLDVSKTNILWFDIEWLGVGDVRCGFVVDGKLVTAHIFHNDNKNTVPYMTTAILPLRYEIKNTGVTASSSTLKQICSTVISEGGYSLSGTQGAVNTALGTPVDLTNASTYYTLISLRLKSTHLDAIAILSAISLLGLTNNAVVNWQIRAGGTTSGTTWVDPGSEYAVEYKLDGGTISGGRILASGYMQSTTQAANPVNIQGANLFKYQLERNGLTSAPFEITLCAASDTAGADVYASMDWEEITR